jgi:hypothetical protein
MTTEQAALASDLRLLDGATVEEASIVLSMVMDMAAWEHEFRDSHGRWTGSGGAHPLSALARAGGMKSPSISGGTAGHPHDVQHMQIQHIAKATASAEARAFTARESARLRAEHEADFKKLMAQVRSANTHMADLEAQAGSEKRKKVLAFHVAIILAGGILGLIGAMTGVAVPLAIGLAVAPAVASEIVDFWKRLS